MEHRRRELVVVIAVVGLIAGAMLVWGGGQTSTILSTVGAAIGPVTDLGQDGAAPEQSAGQSVTADASSGTSGDAGAAVRPPSLLIVRKGTLTLETATIASTVLSAATVVTAAGGFVAGSKESGSAADASAVVDYRIPATGWEPTLARLRGLATVRAQDISTEEVTGQVVDLGARITNLRATEAALQAIMAKATAIRDVLDVQTQLTDTRGRIEQLTAQKAALEDRAAFGSLTVTFRVPPSPAPAATPPPGWDPATDAAAASATLVRVGQEATTAGIWFAIVGLPLLVALALALGIAWLAYRAFRLIERRRTAGDGAAT